MFIPQLRLLQLINWVNNKLDQWRSVNKKNIFLANREFLFQLIVEIIPNSMFEPPWSTNLSDKSSSAPDGWLSTRQTNWCQLSYSILFPYPAFFADSEAESDLQFANSLWKISFYFSNRFSNSCHTKSKLNSLKISFRIPVFFLSQYKWRVN